jgi:hypothetical protein
MKYDRELLLLGARRNAVLELAEVQGYGRDSYGNADYLCIYGLRPAERYAPGHPSPGENRRRVHARRSGRSHRP